MSNLFSLGAYTFEWGPTKYVPPEYKKSVATVKLLEDSAVFQWNAEILGQVITLSWDMMPEAQYQSLYSLYVQPGIVSFDDNNGDCTYNVIISDLSGTLIDVVLKDKPYRVDVSMSMILREVVSS